MPTNRKKVGPQNRGTGSGTGSAQKAVTGSGRSPSVAEKAAEARRGERVSSGATGDGASGDGAAEEES